MSNNNRENYFVQREQLQAAEQALQAFRQQRQDEKSEFAAEFDRLTREHAQNELARRVHMANAAALLECTDDELRELVRQRLVGGMGRSEMIDWLLRTRN